MAITINEALEGLKGSDALIGRPIAARIEKTSDEDVTRQLKYIHRTMVGNLNQANKNIINVTKYTKQEIRKQDADLLLVSDTINSIKIAFKSITEKVTRLEYKVRNLSYQKPSTAISNAPKMDKTSMALVLTAVLSSLLPIIQKIIDSWTKSKSDDKKDDATAEKKDQAIPETDITNIEAQAILIESATTIDITIADTLSAEAKNILLSADEILLESGELLFSTTPIISNTDGIADTWEVGPDAEQQQSPERRRPPDSRGGGGSTEIKSRRRENLNSGVAGSTGDLSSQLGISDIGGGTSLGGGGGRTGGGGGGSGGNDPTGNVQETPPTYDPNKISKDTIFDPITSSNPMGGVGSDSASRGHGAHQGEDWGAPVGTPVYAVRDGCIVRHSRDNFGKLVVVIRHDDGTYTRDMHLQEDSALPVGTRVKGGQKYALSGTANGVPHLHHERWSGPPNKSQLISPSQEAGRNRKDGMKGGQARQGGKIIEPDVAKPTVGPVSDIPAKEVGSQQYASTAEDTSIPENATLTQGTILSDATPDNIAPGQQFASLTTTDKSTDTAVAERDKTVGTTDATATNPDQPAPASPAEKGTLKPSPGGIESILRGFFGRPREPELPPIPKGQQITPVPPYQPPVEPETPAPVPVEPPTQTPITPPIDTPKPPEPPPPPVPPPPPPTPTPPAPAAEIPATTSNPEQETQAPNSGSYGDAPASRDHNSGICII